LWVVRGEGVVDRPPPSCVLGGGFLLRHAHLPIIGSLASHHCGRTRQVVFTGFVLYELAVAPHGPQD
ncbi:MAG: hypothetical protein ACRDQI_08735, partial [Pseudonocardiaceae bacterium]